MSASRQHQAAAYRVQTAIRVNVGYMAWEYAWSDEQRYRRTGKDALRVIAGPMIARLDELADIVTEVRQQRLPAPMNSLLGGLLDDMAPLLDLRPAWLAFLSARAHDQTALEMDMDYGGAEMRGWEHEEEAVQEALALVQVLDRVRRELSSWSGRG